MIDINKIKENVDTITKKVGLNIVFLLNKIII